MLTVLGQQRGLLADRSTRIFDEAGGTFGRSAGCDWVLPDDNHTLSARHAGISHNGRGFLITDTSTNGVYLNTTDAPLGRDQSAPLSNGDTIYAADYIISVTLVPDDPREAVARIARGSLPSGPSSAMASPAATSSAALSPVGSIPAASSPALVPTPAGDRLAAATPAPVDVVPVEPAPQPSVTAIPVPPTPAIPAGFDLSAASILPAVSTPPLPGPAGSAPPVPATTPAPVIPDDFDLGDLSPRPVETAHPVEILAAPAPLAAVRPPEAEPTPLDALALLRQRAAARAATLDLTPQPIAREPAPVGPAPGAPVASPHAALPARMAMPVPAAGADLGDAGAFWTALGIDAAQIPAHARDRLLAELAGALREAADGLVGILAARRSMKDEFRVDQTTLAPKENNPFKFFATGDEALVRVIVEGAPGFLPLDFAVRQCFADIRSHELALTSAIQGGIRRLLDRLDPAALEGGAEPGLLGRRPDKSRLWDSYAELHAELTRDLDRTIRDVVSDEFVAAAQSTASLRGGVQ